VTEGEGALSGPSDLKVEDAWHYPWGEPELNRTARFLTSLSKSKIETTKCRRCHALQWPPRSICSNCLSLDLQWIALPKNGKLVAFTRAYIGGTHGEPKPIVVGAIHLSGGIRLLSRISGATFDSLKVGMTVRFANAKLVDGKPYWEFTPTPTGKR
jgi:uncharacterized OB-fold protein